MKPRWKQYNKGLVAYSGANLWRLWVRRSIIFCSVKLDKAAIYNMLVV